MAWPRSLGRTVAAAAAQHVFPEGASLQSLWWFCLVQSDPVWSASFWITPVCFSSAWFRSSQPLWALLRVILRSVVLLRVVLLSASVLSTVLHGEVVSVISPRVVILDSVGCASARIPRARFAPVLTSPPWCALLWVVLLSVSPVHRPPRRGLIRFSMVVLGTVRSASARVA